MKSFKFIFTVAVILTAFGAAFATKISQQCEGTKYHLTQGTETFTGQGSLADEPDIDAYEPAGSPATYDCLPSDVVCTYYIDDEGDIRQCEEGAYQAAP